MIIITGANGFIGSAMVWELNQRGIHEIICVDSVGLPDRSQPLSKRNYLEFILKDQLWRFLQSAEGKKTKWIIHMGACSSTTETNWEFLKENNLEYSQKISKWCQENSCNLIYASSAATYGDGTLGFDDATDPHLLRPLNLYGNSKVLFDRWLLVQTNPPQHWYGLKFFNVFGPNEYLKESMASVAFKAYHQIKKSHRLGLFKSYDSHYRDGEQMRDFIYVKDVTRFMAELIEKKPKSGIYNMGFGKARSWLDLARSVFDSLNLPTQIDWLDMPENIRNQYQYFTESKMEKWLNAGMSPPQWPLEKAVQDYVQNHLNLEDPWL